MYLGYLGIQFYCLNLMMPDTLLYLGMFQFISLYLFHCGCMYLLNRVPSKAVQKTPFELWTGRKPSLRHLHVWGCQAEVRIFNPQEKKLNARTISGYFIGYPTKSKGYILNIKLWFYLKLGIHKQDI